ncbi:TetR/AcrR family transcriptional regulator [uncultured Pseudosulfitobacter sp.]|uniref:TetR/AcrR family transcriptional regulator n=1 Tax=uncultured Pseudosulfitobacter sp. TaxID=2854214 RepID=UPI0030D8039B|tara:strand:- start:11708 stop:12262 length:555 start_codon:yes stop_codon:yes gene_type:complete
MVQEKTGEQRSGQARDDMSEDPRVAHTRSLLQHALMGLLASSNWNEITVAGLCRRAGVARSSFYEHYRTKSDLLDQIFADLMITIRPKPGRDETLGTLDWLVAHVEDAPDFFARAMAGYRGDALLPRFRNALIRRLSDELTARGVSAAEIKAPYIIGGSMAYLAVVNKAESRDVIHEMAARIIG